MIKLKTLSFKGIGRFVDAQDISFDDLGNLIQVDGQNNNTGGSSGSGKSTVFNALDFLFGLNSISNSALQSRLTEETILVRGEFDLDGQQLVISRGKKLSISINGEVTTGSAKITEEKLDHILSMPRHLFRLMLHKKQREPGFFLNFTPAETNSFLTDCLGLGNFKNKIDNLDQRIVDLSKMISSLTSSLDASNVGLKASRDAMEALGPMPVKDVDQNGILELKNKFHKATEEFKALVEAQKLEENNFLELNRPKICSFDSSNMERLQKAIHEVHNEKSKIFAAARDEENAKQRKISEIKLKQSEFKNKVNAGISAREEATKAAGEILKIRNSVCPRCEQSWTNDSSKSEESKILDRINQLKSLIVGGENASIQLEAAQENLEYISSSPVLNLELDMAKLDDQDRHLGVLIEEEKSEKRNHDGKQALLNKQFEELHREFRNKQALETENLRGQLDLYRRSFEASAMKLKNYEEIRVRYESSLNTLKAQEYHYIQEIDLAEQKLDESKKNLELAEELKRAMKSYLSCSFDEALETISENATKMIQNIPNMSNATIQLEGTKETKEGKVKEEVNSIIHMDGEENIPIKTLSGGERAAVDIAIDIAVLGLIEDRTNKGINVYILDEPFTGLDSANIEMVLEVLKNANTHKKLIVVDHNPVVKEQISDRITIVRDGLISRVTKN